MQSRRASSGSCGKRAATLQGEQPFKKPTFVTVHGHELAMATADFPVCYFASFFCLCSERKTTTNIRREHQVKTTRGVNFSKLIDATAGTLLAEFDLSAASSRPDHKGAPREAKIRDFLRRVLPPQWGVAKAHIVYGGNLTSLEFDVVLYDFLRTPRWPCEGGDDPRLLIPLETVLGIIEVKSTLDKETLVAAHKKIAEFDEILHARVGDSTYRPFRYVFAYRQDETDDFGGWGSPALASCRYATPAARPDGIFVLGQGFSVLATTPDLTRAHALYKGEGSEETLTSSYDVHDDLIHRDVHMDPSYLNDYVSMEAGGGRVLVAMPAFIAERASTFDNFGLNSADMMSRWLANG